VNEFWFQGVALASAKAATIAASFLMAVIAVLIDMKNHTWPSAILAVLCGTVLGVISAISIVSLMGWTEQVGYGVSAIFGIAGNGLVKWIIKMSQDPSKLLDMWRKKP
jgi:hypothetical protein